MSILSKIKAFFRFKGQPTEVEVPRAEIKKDRVFLHPVDDNDHVVAIKSSDVNILISPNVDLNDGDVQVFERTKKEEQSENKSRKSSKRNDNNPTVWKQRPLSDYMPPKKTISIKLYPEDYDAVMESMKGLQKNEFFLACFTSAKKNSLEATYKRYTAEHKARHKAERKAAELAREQDYVQWKKQMEENEQVNNEPK